MSNREETKDSTKSFSSPEYRLYTFVNFYLSSIQQGVQTQHAASELYNKYVFDGVDTPSLGSTPLEILRDWSMNHKTTIVLNGGNHGDIKKISELIEEIGGLALPWASFNEDDESLGGIMTAVAIVLPDTIYDVLPFKKFFDGVQKSEKISDELRNAWFYGDPDGHNFYYAPGSDTDRFITMLKSKPLAR